MTDIKNELAAAAGCDDALLRLRTVCALVGLAPTPLKKLIHRGEFEPPIRLGPTVHRWRAGAVKAWLQAKAGNVL